VGESAKAFLALTPARKAIVLSRLIHAETIRARVAFYDTPTSSEKMFKANERMHRLAGYTMAVLSVDDAERDVFATDLLIASESVGDDLVDLSDWTFQASKSVLAKGVH
jgi:hypothetical protein